MGIFDKKKTEDNNPYYGLRKQALNIKPADIGIALDNNEQVYAAVVDMPFPGKKVVTLVCIFDGTVSLYYSTGGGLLGSGQEYEAVRKAGMSFLFSAGQTLKFLDKAGDYNLPAGDYASVYLLAGDGVYKAEFNMGKTEKCGRHIQFLNFLIQNTLNNIRENAGF